MANQTNSTPPPPGGFIRALRPDDETIGGKARSLARLAALGLPVPDGFAIGAALFHRLRAAGPPLPRSLASLADVAALDAARAALETTTFPDGFERDLDAALEACVQAHDAANTWDGFAVRSSFANEDRTGALGAGVYASVLRVPRSDVAEAIRRVLASCLTPAAWVYQTRGPAADPSVSVKHPDAAVLIHPFVVGDAAGTAAIDSLPTPTPTPTPAPTPAPVRVDVHFGEPSATARAAIDRAVRAGAARYGAIEIEWVAREDTLTVLQLRGYQAAPNHALDRSDARSDATSAVRPPPAHPVLATDVGGGVARADDDSWTWDAAHNPMPLSPAQAGLVQLVDATCRIGVRQKVDGGYLFFQRSSAPLPPQREILAREVFDQLANDIGARLLALGPEPSLAAAIDLFVAAYQPLFGVVGPACVAARSALQEFLGPRLTNPAQVLTDLLDGVPSAASQRRAAAHAIASASTPPGRQSAIDDYVRQFGDESPRWDVAEPTLRESQAVFLPLALSQPGQPTEPTPASQPARLSDASAGRDMPLDQKQRTRFEALLAAARDATAVREDDDALYARLQATVRRGLLGIGRRLHAVRRLRAVDDVFYLPLDLVRKLEGVDPASDREIGSAPEGDLNAIAAAGREAFRLALTAPPPVSRIASPAAEIIRGLGGAGGRVVGRAVHHPASTPLGPGSVLIAATLLPTELPLLIPGALVVETGSILDHVAAQARERGIPAVVGAAGARMAIPEGALVVVDGDRGEVVRLGGL